MFPQQYTFDTLVRGLRTPTAFAFLPNGNVIVNQKADSSKIYTLNNQLVSCFWNFSDSIVVFAETGLIGVCIDPNYASNNYIYLYYTHNTPASIRVVRLTNNNNQGINPLIIFNQTVSMMSSNHVAGNIHFGKDNKLYISIGDMNLSAQAQSLSSFRGKILRINSDGSIPTDNPFYDDGNPLTGNDDRIWAYGLRNSFDFTFSPFNDSLYATENGPAANDEINFIRKGKNYGWPVCSGFCVPYNPLYKQPMDTLPGQGMIGGNFAPTGILIYNGSVMPELHGKLIVAGSGGQDQPWQGIYKCELGNPPFFDTIISRTKISNFHYFTTVLRGADGYIYLAKISPAGMILRMKPSTIGVSDPSQPVNFSLSQNYPNPFNPVTKIKYEMPKPAFVTLKVYNALGMEVTALVNEQKQMGSYEVEWDASNYPRSGVYFYELVAGDPSATLRVSVRKKMVLVK